MRMPVKVSLQQLDLSLKMNNHQMVVKTKDKGAVLLRGV